MSFFIPNQSLISYLSLRCGTETLPATVVKDNSRSRLKRQRERLIASKKLIPWHASHCGASHQCDKINSVRESQSQTKAARRSSTRETEKVPVLRISAQLVLISASVTFKVGLGGEAVIQKGTATQTWLPTNGHSPPKIAHNNLFSPQLIA